MSKITACIAAMGLAFSLLVGVSGANAQASRTWVSGVGDDANPCSRTAPCKTFAGAISKTAACGEIDALDPGGFGAVTITKGITLDGGGGQVASILVAGTNGINVNVTDPTCTKVQLRNLSIQGLGPSASAGINGVNVIAGFLTVEHVTIENFSNDCINFQPSVHASLVVDDSNFEACAHAGVETGTSGGGVNRVNINRSTLQKNGIGISLLSASDVTVMDSMISVNGLGGVETASATSQVSLVRDTVTNNQVFGVYATNSGVAILSEDSITFNNGTGLLSDTGGQIQSFANNWLTGNTFNGGATSLVGPS